MLEGELSPALKWSVTFFLFFGPFTLLLIFDWLAKKEIQKQKGKEDAEH